MSSEFNLDESKNSNPFGALGQVRPQEIAGNNVIMRRGSVGTRGISLGL